jgi:hypothetical protein
LLTLYKNSPRSALASSERLGRIQPDLDAIRKLGFLRGWAVIGFKKPTRVTLRIGDVVLGEATRFYARPDVRDRMQAEGRKIKTDAFGFMMRVPNGIDRSAAILYCEDGTGRTISLPLLEVASGDTVQLGEGHYVSITREHVTWRKDLSGFLRGWAAIGLAAPTLVAVRIGDRTVGEAARFLARPDVREGLVSEGENVSAEMFGFSIFLPSGIDRTTATIYCADNNGRTITLPLREIPNGHRISLGNGDYVAVESEFLPRKAKFLESAYLKDLRQ